MYRKFPPSGGKNAAPGRRQAAQGPEQGGNQPLFLTDFVQETVWAGADSSAWERAEPSWGISAYWEPSAPMRSSQSRVRLASGVRVI